MIVCIKHYFAVQCHYYISVRLKPFVCNRWEFSAYRNGLSGDRGSQSPLQVSLICSANCNFFRCGNRIYHCCHQRAFNGLIKSSSLMVRLKSQTSAPQSQDLIGECWCQKSISETIQTNPFFHIAWYQHRYKNKNPFWMASLTLIFTRSVELWTHSA